MEGLNKSDYSDDIDAAERVLYEAMADPAFQAHQAKYVEDRDAGVPRKLDEEGWAEAELERIQARQESD